MLWRSENSHSGTDIYLGENQEQWDGKLPEDSLTYEFGQCENCDAFPLNT